MVIQVYSNNSVENRRLTFEASFKNLEGYAHKLNTNNSNTDIYQEEEPEYFENNQIGYDYYYIPDHKYFVLSNTASEDAIFRAENISNNRIDVVVGSTSSGSQTYITSSGSSFRLSSNNSSAFFYIATGGSNPIDRFIIKNNGNVIVNSTITIDGYYLTGGWFTGIDGSISSLNSSISSLAAAATKISQNNQEANSSYVLAASDSGKHILANGAINIVSNTFTTGDHFYIVKAPTAAAASLIPDVGVTLYLRSDVGNTFAANTNVDLTNIGVLHVICTSTNTSPETFVAY